ncbi:uncharacterized protein LOC123514632 [Portunus trituberculatus]|uniref:uncharacterized protein LOC123514632 n=1 Tax=Portunus trituberculatus TaxID=210409 RepID=UPI001E1D16DB|nr:uncharacterized protein LOC123514632 [Portunus trituberculatus]
MSLGSYRSAGYGETMAASGYGVSRYVDCNSALALLGFILFVDILRDIIEDVTAPAEEERGLRRKRWAARQGTWGSVSGEPDILTFVSEGGDDHFYDILPSLLSPLMDGAWHREGDDCARRRVCEMNRALGTEYGVSGRIFGTLLSNLVSRTSSGENSAMLEAAREGRRGQRTCASAFPACQTLTSNVTWPASLAPVHLHRSPINDL